jgi:hypothetical protein
VDDALNFGHVVRVVSVLGVMTLSVWRENRWLQTGIFETDIGISNVPCPDPDHHEPVVFQTGCHPRDHSSFSVSGRRVDPDNEKDCSKSRDGIQYGMQLPMELSKCSLVAAGNDSS